ncbi:MAG: competence/damage-inducible protein A [Dongiaceae bacterium]
MAEIKAAVLIIGNEVLSGRTQDANLAFLADALGKQGVLLTEARVVRDEEMAIVRAVNDLRVDNDYVFTTGGIGPTHDDITMASIAKAFSVPVEINPDAEAALHAYYASSGREVTPERLRMAMQPRGSKIIPNPIGGGPGAAIENVFILPGVPSQMQAMAGPLIEQLKGGPAFQSMAVTTDLYESVIAKRLAAIQAADAQVEIGSYPHSDGGRYMVRLVVRGQEAARIQRAVQEIRAMIKELNGNILDAPATSGGKPQATR